MFNVRYTKRGGMHFLRLGRLQLSFCLCSTAKTRALFNPQINDTDLMPRTLPARFALANQR